MVKRHNNEKEIVRRYKLGESATKIAKSMNLFTTSITRVLKRNGFKCGHKKGKEHPMWKGGRGLKSGYWTIYNPNHHRALNNGRVYEHIIILENHLGIKIKKEQPIHHIDFDRQNNKIENLYLCKNHKEHRELHNGLEFIARELFNKKNIGFKNGKYYLK